MVGDKVLASADREAEPTHQPGKPVEFEMLFRFWDGFCPEGAGASTQRVRSHELGVSGSTT
jgi:hypothetical protein